MPSIKLKVARIGNSRGVRLPAASLKRYRIGDAVLMEERSDGILLRPIGSGVQKLSWEETAHAMAASSEDWSQWETVDSDGLDDLPWQASTPKERVAERPARFTAKRRSAKRR